MIYLLQRLFPVPLFPQQQDSKSDDVKYIRVSIPVSELCTRGDHKSRKLGAYEPILDLISCIKRLKISDNFGQKKCPQKCVVSRNLIQLFQKNSMLPEYKPKIQRKPIDTEDSLCLWDHCVRGYSHQVAPRKQAKTKNKLDLRSHLDPFDAADVYKVKSGQSFKLGPGSADPFDLTKLNFEEKL